jgi:hypothetical protein
MAPCMLAPCMRLPAIPVAIPRRHAADHARTMAFSAENPQDNGGRRDAAPQANPFCWKMPERNSAAMPAMPGPAMMGFVLAAAHRQAARLAELRIFRVHASRHFRDVRNDVGAQPHRVGRAGLLLFGTALSTGAIEAPNQGADQQHETANKTHSPHSCVPRSSK